ncbi:unnamed protein product [Choristocarpus tenellus]
MDGEMNGAASGSYNEGMQEFLQEGPPEGVGGMGQPLVLPDPRQDNFGGFEYNEVNVGLQPQMPMVPAPRRPTDLYTEEESAGVLENLMQAFEAQLSERAQLELQKAGEALRRAEEDLDRFYDDRTDQVARRQAVFREQEESFLQGINSAIVESATNPWARVCDLVDLKEPLPKIGANGLAGRRGKVGVLGEVEALVTEDASAFQSTEKMRSLIIQMKAEVDQKNSNLA